MPKIRRKSIENDFLLIFFLHAERGCRSIIYFNDFATPSFGYISVTYWKKLKIDTKRCFFEMLFEIPSPILYYHELSKGLYL